MPSVEVDTRFIIDAILVNKGWYPNPEDKNRNVYFESSIQNVVDPKIVEKLKKAKKRPDYVLIDRTNDCKPIAIIEAKAGGKDLEKALDQAYEYAEILEAPLIFAMNNCFCQTRHLFKQKPLYIKD